MLKQWNESLTYKVHDPKQTMEMEMEMENGNGKCVHPDTQIEVFFKDYELEKKFIEFCNNKLPQFLLDNNNKSSEVKDIIRQITIQ